MTPLEVLRRALQTLDERAETKHSAIMNALKREVRNIIADAIHRYPTQEKYGETGYSVEGLRLARAIVKETPDA